MAEEITRKEWLIACGEKDLRDLSLDISVLEIMTDAVRVQPSLSQDGVVMWEGADIVVPVGDALGLKGFKLVGQDLVYPKFGDAI